MLEPMRWAGRRQRRFAGPYRVSQEKVNAGRCNPQRRQANLGKPGKCDESTASRIFSEFSKEAVFVKAILLGTVP
jgi:hypothetical protein